MTDGELTRAASPAKSRSMQRRLPGWQWALGGMLAVAGSATLGGCISVNAPDKPIVIELNINIRQEVIYRLASDATNAIDKNEDIF